MVDDPSLSRRRALRAFAASPLHWLRIAYTFNRYQPPDDPGDRELWALVGATKYRWLRAIAWQLKWLYVPLFGILTVIMLALAVTHGGGYWLPLGIVGAGLAGSTWLARAWRGDAARLENDVSQGLRRR